jgi:hypothetical protein
VILSLRRQMLVQRRRAQASNVAAVVSSAGKKHSMRISCTVTS